MANRNDEQVVPAVGFPAGASQQRNTSFSFYDLHLHFTFDSFHTPALSLYDYDLKMPKIRSFTPSWLSTDSTDGRGLFSPSAASARKTALAASTASPHTSSVHGSPNKKQAANIPGPRRTIARRGTEVFIANGREIRWADLVTMKDAWEATQDGFSKSTSNTAPSTPAYRVSPPSPSVALQRHLQVFISSTNS